MLFVLPEAWAKVNAHVAMSLFKSVVFVDVMQVVTSDDNGALHLHFADNTCEDAATNGNVTAEGTLLVDVGTFNRLKKTFNIV